MAARARRFILGMPVGALAPAAVIGLGLFLDSGRRWLC